MPWSSLPNLHPAVVHLPLGILPVALLVDLLSLDARGGETSILDEQMEQLPDGVDGRGVIWIHGVTVTLLDQRVSESTDRRRFRYA